MILLDEIDVKEKEKRESLPPYSPRRSLRPPAIATPPNTGSLRSFTSVQSSLHPRSASVPSATLGHSRSSLTLSSNTSSQTLVPPLPTPPPSAQGPGPSTSQLSVSLVSSLASLPAHRTYPPLHLRAANTVYVQRESATITGAFLIDPSLQVPDCLLPDDLDVLLIPSSAGKVTNGKGKQKRANLCLVTRSGDVCVDVWIREGCARLKTGALSRNGGGSSVNSYGSSSRSGRNSLDSQESADYWRADWTSPPPSHPWPEKTKARTDIDIRSETGSITVRIHAQSHQRLRIRLSSVHGSISIGVPRYFAGYVQANANTGRSDSADSMSSSVSRSPSASLTYLPGSPGAWANEKERPDVGGTSSGSVFGESAQAPPITPRQPVQFSTEMEEVVTALSEHRKNARGRYLVGDSPNKLVSEHMGVRYFDELHVESRTGTMGVFFNDEALQQKSDRLITKLLNKAW